MRRFAGLMAAILWVSGCTYTALEDVQCERTADCPQDAVCRSGYCAYDGTPNTNNTTNNTTNNALIVASVAVTPPTATLTPEESLQASASAANAAGDPLADVTFTWSSSNEEVATVSDTGEITAVDVGTADITATADGVSAALVLTVENPVAQVNIMPTTNTVGLNTEITLSAVALDARGNELSPTFTWATSDASIARVSNAGVVFGVGVGETTITATAGGIEGTASISVVDFPIVTLELDPATARVRQGATVNIRAVLTNDQGTEVVGETVNWGYMPAILGGLAVPDLDRPDIVRFTASTSQTGTATITAGYEALSSTASIEVYRPMVKSVTVTPMAPTSKVGALIAMTAAVIDEDDLPLTGRTVTWTVSDPALAAVDANGLLRTLAKGTVTVEATVDGVKGSTDVTIAGFELDQISAGDAHTCGVTPAGYVFCWGENGHRQLGDGSNTDRSLPVALAVDTTFDQVVAGNQHTCARSGTSVVCWGAQTSGRLGNGQSMMDEGTPQPVSGGLAFLDIDTLRDHTCGLTDMDALYCWGRGADGRLGNDSVNDQSTPVQITSPAMWQKVATGYDHTCGLTLAGELYCWGANASGQVGDATTTERRVPTAVNISAIGTPTFTDVYAGNKVSCALTSNNELYCWGANDKGQLGFGSDDASASTPRLLALAFSNVALGNGFGCGIAGATAYCWGDGALGRLGNAATTVQKSPVAIGGNPMFSHLAAGNHGCGLQNGAAKCWGPNDVGQLGIGATSASELLPTNVYP